MERTRTVVTTRCLACAWAADSTLGDARGHSLKTSHRGFRTVTELFSTAGRRIGELVEVHQF